MVGSLYNPGYQSMTNRNRILLIAIIFAAIAVRFWDLGHNPNGLSCDEAANGYNAYSIWMTGRDYSGRVLPPLILVHYFDYVESLYTYLTVPFVALLGLNEMSIRIVPALFGVLTIWSTFLLSKKMFGTKIAFMACLFLVFSPWHVIYSRFSSRPVLLPFFITLGLYFFLEGLQKPRALLGAGITFGISAYTYSTVRVFLPLLLLGLLIIYRNEITQPRNRRWIIIAALIIIIITLPMVTAVISGKTTPRFKEISTFNTDAPFKTFLKNYALHYTPSFLFFTGDKNLRHNPLYVGQELIVLAPFMVVGLIKLISERKKKGFLIIYWIIIAGIPAAFTNEGIPHAGRSLQFIPSLEILAASGFIWVWDVSGSLRIRYWLRGLISSAIAINIAIFIFILFFVHPIASAKDWQYGNREAFAEAIALASPGEPIFITRHIWESYIFALFYTQKDPRPWQTNRFLGRFILCRDNMTRYYHPQRPGIYIIRPGEVPGSRPLRIIRYPSGEPAFEIIR